MKSTEEIYIWNRKTKYSWNQQILTVKCIKPGTIKKLWSKPLNHFVNWTIKRYKNVINEYCMFRRKYSAKFIFAPFSLVVVRMTNSNGNFLIWINIQKINDTWWHQVSLRGGLLTIYIYIYISLRLRCYEEKRNFKLNIYVLNQWIILFFSF